MVYPTKRTFRTDATARTTRTLLQLAKGGRQDPLRIWRTCQVQSGSVSLSYFQLLSAISLTTTYKLGSNYCFCDYSFGGRENEQYDPVTMLFTTLMAW
jgi:hypothetical protein